MNIRNVRLKKRWIVLAAAVLVVFVAVLLWHTNIPNHTEGESPSDTQQNAVDAEYSHEELWAEAERTCAVLKQHGIRVYGYTGSRHDNAAKVIVDPRDKARLAVTQEGVPKKDYYRLVRENDPVPVYIIFEGPYTNLN